MESKSTKRRFFACSHCRGAGNGYVGKRYRVIDHVMKHHLALDQTPFYCKLCMFRCSTVDQLNRHVTSYKRHVTMAAMPEYQGEASRYLVRNPSARSIEEGTDYRPLTAEEQQQLRPAESPVQAVTPNQGSQQDLVTVQLPPSVLASLLSSNNTNQTNHNVSVPPALQYDPTRPSLTGATNTNLVDSMFNPSIPGCTDEPTSPSRPVDATDMTRYQPTPILPTMPQLRIPDLHATRSRSHTPAASVQSAFSPLNTPVLHPREVATPVEEDIMPQLLGDSCLPEDMVFSPVPVPSTSRQPEPPAKKTIDQMCQTEPLPAPRDDSLAPLNVALERCDKTVEIGLSKVTFAVESVARATRHVQQSFDTLATSLSQISRSMERFMDEQRRQARRGDQTSTKRPREYKDKENDKALKSVVTKKTNHRR